VHTPDISVAGTMFPLIPEFVRLDSPAVSKFFAGTRYGGYDSNFTQVRQRVGEVVSFCAPAPSAADVLHILTNYPLFQHSRMHQVYHALSHVDRMKKTMKRLDAELYNLDAMWLRHFQGHGEAPGMTEEQYDALGTYTPAQLEDFFDKHKQAIDARGAAGKPDAPKVTYEVYGRYDQDALAKAYPRQSLRPCPYTIKAVELLKSKGLPFVVREVPNWSHPSIPVQKPLSHQTVPVVFARDTSLPHGHSLQFVGGFSDLEAALNK